MKRMIAAFAIIALAIAIAVYIATAPLASPTASGSLNALLASFDTIVMQIEAAVGRSTGALCAIGAGLILALVVGLFPSRKKSESESADDLLLDQELLIPEPDPAPVKPSSSQPAQGDGTTERLAHLRSRAKQEWLDDARDAQHAEPEEASDPSAAQDHESPEQPASYAAQPAPGPAQVLNTRSPEEAANLKVGPCPLVRKMREPNRDWFGDNSWFGGLPRLGQAPWPTDAHGTPLPFLAQIDLAQLAKAAPSEGLPDAQALAFFLGHGGVVPVPYGNHEFTEPPQGLPAAFDEGGGLLPPRTTRLTRWLFPFWPLEPGNSALSGADAPLTRDHPFYAAGVGEPVETLWWHSVDHFADRLHQALGLADKPIQARRKRLEAMRQTLAQIENDPDADPYERDDAREDAEAAEAELARMLEQRQALPEMLDALDAFREGRDPWSVLSPEEREVLRDLLPETHERYGELIGDAIPGSLAELATISLRTAISGPAEAVSAIPAELLDRLNREYRLPPESQHQMFAASPNQDELILIDLAWDDLLEWDWPDEGHFQLRITKADAAAGNWQAANAMFVSA